MATPREIAGALTSSQSSSSSTIAEDDMFVTIAQTQTRGWGLMCGQDVEVGETIIEENGLFLYLDNEFQRPWPGPETIGRERFVENIRTIANFMQGVERLVLMTAEAAIGDLVGYLSTYFARRVKEPQHISGTAVFEALFGHLGYLGRSEEQQQFGYDVFRFLNDALYLDTGLQHRHVFAFGTFACLLNHSCQPNAIAIPRIDASAERPGMFTGTVYVRAIRPIQAGEEITIAYLPDIESSREEHQDKITNLYDFECLCSACESDKHDAHQRDLKDVVYGLYGEIRKCMKGPNELDNTPAPELFRKAAVVLDGFDALNICHQPKKYIYDVCARKAWNGEDLLRTYFFVTKSLQWSLLVHGIPSPEVMAIIRDREGIRRCQVEKEDDSAETYSTYQAYDMSQDLLEDLMFMMNHEQDDTVYHCLQVVDGKVEEVPEGAIGNRVKAARQRQQQLKDQSRSIDDIAREIEAMDGSEPKKLSKKARKRAKKAAREADEEEVVSLPASAPFQWTEEEPFVCLFGAADGVSKQAWLRDSAAKEALRFEPRDVGHLLAAKDGMSTDQERFVLSARRDSISGRIQGEKEFAELAGRFGRKARTHSFGNDGSKKDLLKEAEVRESQCW
ncbi:hypothetical protein A1O1_03979 [Capronia coronata CBS 617.96]|uniref:SET domain-containing protein n=1 Tax=Capronia coronata CBS 617.96 TaxID=1182541 RepID=W9Z8Q7_9EURO|nr:uncharacterized protein A1O1_03979 [Capronia coronata CBS 617.96]EXJ90874.1 hypothetical protein A1O1_03979 [Capronia coronata CBS 617.96]